MDIPRTTRAHAAGPVIAVWLASGMVWGAGVLLAIPGLFYLAAVVFLGALLLTLRYFAARTAACRHCGSPDLEPTTSG